MANNPDPKCISHVKQLCADLVWEGIRLAVPGLQTWECYRTLAMSHIVARLGSSCEWSSMPGQCRPSMSAEFNGHIQCVTQAVHALWHSAGCNMHIHDHFLQRVILTGKVGHINLVFGTRSGFISRSVYARWQVSVCSGYDLF